MRSDTDLLEASGYTEHPEDFNLLLRILDGELRLITPTDVGGSQTTESGDASSKFYQLTARLSGARAARVADVQTTRDSAGSC